MLKGYEKQEENLLDLESSSNLVNFFVASKRIQIQRFEKKRRDICKFLVLNNWINRANHI